MNGSGMLIVKRSIADVKSPATKNSGAFVKNGLVSSSAGVNNPDRLIPAEFKKTVEPVVFDSVPLNVSAEPGEPERRVGAKPMLIISA
jgi:hypothetical protein